MKFQLKFFALPLVFILIVAIVVGCGCKAEDEDGKFSSKDKINLTYWRLFDDRDTIQPIIDEYQKKNKNITITYKKFSYEDYERQAIDELAAGKGPDIWMIQNDWLPRHKDKLTPMPEEMMNTETYRTTFVDVATDDLVDDNRIYGIPLTVDSLALFWNKDLFNKAGISQPPATWDDLIKDVSRLTKTRGNTVNQSAMALGTATNVSSAANILSWLMMQNGATMIDEAKNQAIFNARHKTEDGQAYYPGISALEFYTSFADPAKQTYSWNSSMLNSIDAFLNSKAAMVLAPSFQVKMLQVKSQSKTPKLQFDVAPAPQIKDGITVNAATYFAEVVSKNCENPDAAWDFLTFLSDKENMQKYHEATQRPPSRKDLVEGFANEQYYGVFSVQAPSAKSFYKVDSNGVDRIFVEMITSVNNGEKAKDAIDKAASEITKLMSGQKAGGEE
ncbi:extracellular solute-binding protein [Patescibacteria group bacterium]|nr:MAG: extracellular solute-binding protein [Patescibacteria group bacterium]